MRFDSLSLNWISIQSQVLQFKPKPWYNKNPHFQSELFPSIHCLSSCGIKFYHSQLAFTYTWLILQNGFSTEQKDRGEKKVVKRRLKYLSSFFQSKRNSGLAIKKWFLKFSSETISLFNLGGLKFKKLTLLKWPHSKNESLY